MDSNAPIRIEVALKAAPYQVLVGDGVLDSCGSSIRAIRPCGKVAVVTDANVADIYADQVLSSLTDAEFSPSLIVVPAGESSKCLAGVEMICDAMISGGHDRASLLVALGGGVVGDLAGFAAAVYFRGIPFVQLPTTVVAQVDSSVGGKTGVNATGGKNLIGAFHQPALVLADPLTLDSLPPREFNEGVAEIIKHAAIRDPGMLAHLDPQRRDNLAPLIARNVAIKAEIVAADERETSGLRALLNFGHTIGHAVENAAGYGELLHGEAISIGLRGALLLSIKRAGLAQAGADQVLDALRKFDLPLRLPTDLSPNAILAAMQKDKKFTAGKMRFVLLRALGDAFLTDAVTEDDVRETLDTLRTAVT